MDPYIELHREWCDFHTSLATELRTALNRVLKTAYYAVTTSYTTHDIMPMADAGQSRVPLEVEVRITNVEVREAGTDRLITAIEILSPVNKRPGPQREQYLRKRRELFRTDFHVIEIDLLRDGQRSLLEIPPPPAAYYISLGRGDNRPTVDVWAMGLQERLPCIPIPLIDPDPDVPLDLGAIVREVYERGAFARRLDYTQPPPPPPLTETEQAWVDDLLAPYRQAMR
jgi:hypothetical protein